MTENIEHYKTKHQQQFWSWKFTSNSNLNEAKRKIINQKKKKKRKKKQYIGFCESIYNNRKIFIKFSDTEIQKQQFYQRKIPISITNIDINKGVVSNKVSFGKKRIWIFHFLQKC